MTENILPIDRVRESDNGYTHFCEALGQRCFYRTCLHLIDSMESGRSPYTSKDNDCGHALSHGTCAAKQMRNEELKAEKAIYFQQRLGTLERPMRASNERSARIDKNSASYRRGWAALDKVQSPMATSSDPAHIQPKPASIDSTSVEHDAAQAVNDLISNKKRIYTNQELHQMGERVKALIAAGKKSQATALFAQLKQIIHQKQQEKTENANP